MNPRSEGSIVYAEQNSSSLVASDIMQFQASSMCLQDTTE